jgi:hypothetical protein
MNNEPVAWARQDGVIAFHKKPEVDSQGFKWFALYTHPVKELTDEEILNVLKKIADNNEYVYSLYEDFSEVEFSKVGIFEFARAILRKAQEK